MFWGGIFESYFPSLQTAWFYADRVVLCRPFINPYNNVEDVMYGMHYAASETGPIPMHLEMEALITEGRKPESVVVTVTTMRYPRA